MNIISLSNPRQTVLLSTRWQKKDNIITLNWHMPVSLEPMMYAVSIGKTRYSLKLLRKSKVFVINFIPYDLKKEALYCGRYSGRKVDKFEKTGLIKEEAEIIDCSRVQQALGWLECKIKKEIEAGDSILFVAEVSKAHLRHNSKRLFHVFGDKFTSTID